MKITLNILIPIFSFGRAGGMRVLSKLANYWEKMGCNVTFVSFYESEDPYYPVETNIIWIDTKGHEVRDNNSDFSVKNSLLKRTYALYKYLKVNSDNYDIVLANHNLTVWPVWFGSKSNNFYYIQAYEVEFSSGKNLRFALKRVFAYLTYYLPLTKVVNADIYLNYKNIRSKYVVPAGIDLDIYYPKKSKRSSTEEFVIGCIGRKAEWKGSNDVGEAVRILRLKGYKVNFRVAFESIKYKEHELVKPDGDENLSQFYRDVDVLVAPGHIQLGAIHYPVIEAMACKTPVITTGYYPANAENAYIVPIKRPDIIAETLEHIIENYDEAVDKAGIAYSNINEFAWQRVSSKFLGIFEDELKED